MTRNVLCILPVLLPLVLSCQGDGRQQAPGFLEFMVPMALTKGEPQAVMYDRFACWGYVYETEPSTPSYLCGESFVRAEGDVFRSSGLHAAIPEGLSLRFWALAPADAAGISGLPSAESLWPPSFRLQVPAEPSAQRDVTAAASTVYYGGSPGGYALVFKHLLSCVQFRTTISDVPSCRVLWIELSGVKGAGSYEESTGWGSLDSPATYRVTSGCDLDASCTDQPLHDARESLMLIPQTLGADAELNVGLETGSVVSQRVASLDGLELVQGCLNVIRLSIPATGSLEVTVSVAPWEPGPGFYEKSGIPEGTPLER